MVCRCAPGLMLPVNPAVQSLPHNIQCCPFPSLCLSRHFLRHCGTALCILTHLPCLRPGPWRASQEAHMHTENSKQQRELKMLPFGYVGLSQNIGRSPQSSKTLALKKLLSLTGWPTATQMRELPSYLTGMILPSCA